MDPLQVMAVAAGGLVGLWLVFPKMVSLVLRYLFSCEVSLEQIGFFPLSVKQFSMRSGSLGICFDSLFVGKNNVESDTYFRVEIAGLNIERDPEPDPEPRTSWDVGSHVYERLISKLSGVLGWASYALDGWKVTVGTVFNEQNVKVQFQV